MSEELRPCPFCGEMPKVNNWTLKGITDKRCFCDNENCPVYLSKTIAIDDWNTRPIEDALTARIAELELRLDVYNSNMYDVVVDENAKANKRIAELEALVDELVNIGDNLFDSLNPIAWKHEWLDKWWKLSSCRRGERE